MMGKARYYFCIYSIAMLGITSSLSAMSESFAHPRQLTDLLRPFFKENPLPLHGRTYAHTDFIKRLVERALEEPSFEETTVTPQQVYHYCKFFIQHNDNTRRRNAAFLARCVLCLEKSGKLLEEEARFIITLIDELKKFPTKEASSFAQRETCLKVITPYLLAIYAKQEELAASAAAEIPAKDDADNEGIIEKGDQEKEETIESDSDEEIPTLRHRRRGRNPHRNDAQHHRRKHNPSPVAGVGLPVGAPLPVMPQDYSDSDNEADYCSRLCMLLKRCCRW